MPHGGVILKAYAVGSLSHSVERSSLPNLRVHEVSPAGDVRKAVLRLYYTILYFTTSPTQSSEARCLTCA